MELRQLRYFVAVAHIDPWVAPSRTQAARVADGSLDLAVCWAREQDLEELGLHARLIGADRLHAVSTGDDNRDDNEDGDDGGDVRARDVVVLPDCK